MDILAGGRLIPGRVQWCVGFCSAKLRNVEGIWFYKRVISKLVNALLVGKVWFSIFYGNRISTTIFTFVLFKMLIAEFETPSAMGKI